MKEIVFQVRTLLECLVGNGGGQGLWVLEDWDTTGASRLPFREKQHPFFDVQNLNVFPRFFVVDFQ